MCFVARRKDSFSRLDFLFVYQLRSVLFGLAFSVFALVTCSMEDSLAVQTQAVEKLRALVGVLPADLLVAGSSDTALRRFLIARKWNVEVAAASIKKTIEWRRAHIPRLLATPIDERLTTLRTLIPGSPLLGFAKTGVPVSLLCPGAAPLDQGAQSYTPLFFHALITPFLCL